MTDVGTGTDLEHVEDRVPAAQRGSTTIAGNVVAKIASIAAREVEGVAGLGGSLSNAMSQVVGRIRGREHTTAGVGVEAGTKQAAVDLTVRMHYPVAVHDVAGQIRQNVIDRVESLAGLQVVEVNIAIIDLVFPDDGDEDWASAPRVQ